MQKPYSIAVEEQLSYSHPNLDIILSDSSVVKGFRFGDSALTDFLGTKIDDLVRRAFLDSSSIISLNSYRIIVFSTQYMQDRIMKSHVFISTLIEILSKDDVTALLIGRIATITQTLLLTGLETAFHSCSYIFRLLSFCHHIGASSLFINICSNEKSYANAQKWLVNVGFSDFVCQMVFAEIIDFKPDTYDLSEKTIRIASYYRIMETAIKNPLLYGSFMIDDIFKALSVASSFSNFVENARWAAILSIFSASKTKSLLPMAKNGILVFYNDITRLCEYHLSILAFLKEVVQIMPDILNSGFFRSLLGHVIQFDQSSWFLNSVIDFVEVCIDTPSLLYDVIIVFVPVVYIESQSRDKGIALTSFCYNILEKVSKVTIKSSELHEFLSFLDGFNSFMHKDLVEYIKFRDSGYGGESSFSITDMLSKMFVGNKE